MNNSICYILQLWSPPLKEPKEDALPKVPATPKPSAVGRSLAETSVWRWNQLGLEACGGQKTHERCENWPGFRSKCKEGGMAGDGDG